MKFPGKRKSKHYFPVNARDPLLISVPVEAESMGWLVGIDQTMVDIEAKVDDEFLNRYGLTGDILLSLRMMSLRRSTKNFANVIFFLINLLAAQSVTHSTITLC